jgi:hypothetical protein
MATILISTTIAAVARSAQAGLHLSAGTSHDPVFISVGPAGAVDGHFAGADIDNVEDVDVDPFRLDVEHRAGTARPGSPDDQTFWWRSCPVLRRRSIGRFGTGPTGSSS